mgnify:FL=1
MARYRLHNLVVETVVGVHLHERTRRQAIHIDVEFTANAMAAAASDSLDDCVDYEALAERIRCELRKTDYELLESVAAFVFELVTSTSGVTEPVVRARKPDALTFAEAVEIELP